MIKFVIKVYNKQEFWEVISHADYLGYNRSAIHQNSNPTGEALIVFYEYDGYVMDKYGDVAIDIIKSLNNENFFVWSLSKGIAIKFMEENIKSTKTVKQEEFKHSKSHEQRLEAIEKLLDVKVYPFGDGFSFKSNVLNDIKKGLDKPQNNAYIYNLEERVHQLEQSLKSERKNTQRIDRKLRSRIQMLESQVDMMENNNPNFVKCKLETYEGLPLNDDAFHGWKERYLFDKHNHMQKVDGGYFWEIKEKQKDKDRPFKSSPYGNYKNKMVFKKSDLDTPKEGAFYSPQKAQDKAIKIAIRVENEEEFNELMDIYQTRSYKRTNLYPSQHKGYYKCFSRFKENGVLYISMENNFSIWDEEHSPISLAYQIIPFKTLKAILG